PGEERAVAARILQLAAVVHEVDASADLVLRKVGVLGDAGVHDRDGDVLALAALPRLRRVDRSERGRRRPAAIGALVCAVLGVVLLESGAVLAAAGRDDLKVTRRDGDAPVVRDRGE